MLASRPVPAGRDDAADRHRGRGGRAHGRERRRGGRGRQGVPSPHENPGPQETDLEPTIYRHSLSGRIIGDAWQDGTIGWVDSLSGIPCFEFVLGCYRLDN